MHSFVTANTTITAWDPAVSPSDCGPVLHYIVTAESLVDASDNITIKARQNRAEFSSIMKGTNYTISVAAVNRAGSGPSSTIIVTGSAEGKQCSIQVVL